METIADFIRKSNFPWEVPACVCLELTGGWWWPLQAGCSPGCTGYVRNLPMPDAKQMLLCNLLDPISLRSCLCLNCLMKSQAEPENWCLLSWLALFSLILSKKDTTQHK